MLWCKASPCNPTRERVGSEGGTGLGSGEGSNPMGADTAEVEVTMARKRVK